MPVRDTRTIARHAVALAACAAAAGLFLAACGADTDQDPDALQMPRFEEPDLAGGRSVWMGTCRACHLLGVAGAPAVTDAEAWEARRGKGRQALYRSALSGVRGADGKYRMPPRGGNQRLSDEQVRLAVDYKLAAIEKLQSRAR
jgi:cytochrome c5